jgi:hypothetical protein
MEDMEREQAAMAANATSIMASPLAAEPTEPTTDAAAEIADSGSARALEQLRWAYAENKADFRQVAALEEPNVEVRDAVRAVLGLSPEVLAALGVVTRLPRADRQIISAAIALPLEVQATLRSVLG